MTVKTTSLNVYLLAGVKTTTGSFNACKERLEEQLKSEGIEPMIHVLYPYGDASRNWVKQVIEVKSDLSNRMKAGRIGGRQVWQQIKETVTGGERTLLIGHSGGGAAAYQAAKMLEEEGILQDFRIVQVGSPRTPIHPRLQEKVSYFHSIDHSGKMNDPISRIGSWGGWIKAGLIPQWNSYKYAPGYVEGIPTVGGHADYFRNTEAYMDTESVCNLDKTIGRVRAWLKGWL